MDAQGDQVALEDVEHSGAHLVQPARLCRAAPSVRGRRPCGRGRPHQSPPARRPRPESHGVLRLPAGGLPHPSTRHRRPRPRTEPWRSGAFGRPDRGHRPGRPLVAGDGVLLPMRGRHPRSEDRGHLRTHGAHPAPAAGTAAGTGSAAGAGVPQFSDLQVDGSVPVPRAAPARRRPPQAKIACSAAIITQCYLPLGGGSGIQASSTATGCGVPAPQQVPPPALWPWGGHGQRCLQRVAGAQGMRVLVAQDADAVIEGSAQQV